MTQFLVVWDENKLIVNADKMFEGEDELRFLNHGETNDELVALITKPKKYALTQTEL